MRPSLLRSIVPLLAASLTSAAALAQTPPAKTPPASSDANIQLAPEDRDPPKEPSQPIVSFGAGTPSQADLLRGLAEQRFRAAAAALARTSIGGYGELMVNGVTAGKDAKSQWSADVRRFVIFVAHEFSNSIRAYTEIEIEHTSSIDVEQAMLDWRVGGDYLGLRAGLLLTPMGIINEYHEPPIFNGVVRPRVETVVIPSTWREFGAGFFGRPIEPLRYELYAMAGLNPLAFSAGGFSAARGGARQSNAKAWAVAGRVEYEPMVGLVLGVSGYASDAGKNAATYLRDGTRVDVSAPVFGYSLDARFRRLGVEWRVLFTEWHMPEAAALMKTYDAKGAPLFPDPSQPLPTRIRGAYVEGGYDVLRFFGVSHQLVPFGRLEFYDTQSAVPAGYTANPTYSVREYTFGASYRPIPEFVVKADYQLRNRKVGTDETQANIGLGFMY
jgi:hypothetical protein